MQQSPLTVIVPIQEQKIEALGNFLKPIGNDIRKNSILRFYESPSTHFARFVILPDQSGGPQRLLFSSNYDGALPAYAGELSAVLGAGLNDVFCHCQSYRAGTATNAQQLLAFLNAHSFSPSVFYVACRGASVKDIHDAIRIRETLDILLDNMNGSPFENILPLLRPDLVPAPAADSGPGSSLWTRLFERFVGIRHGEQQISRRMKHRPDLVEVEDRITQNQMTVVSPLKNQFWRPLLLKAVFASVRAQAGKSHGSLSGLTTIHFARWVMIDDGQTILFESNYDGSWENYIDDFVDFASLGMNSIWGNCTDFPTGGCEDIEAFKEGIRRSQVPAQVFYSAYPNSTVRNNLSDLALRQALREPAVNRFVTGCYSSSN